MIRCKIIFNRIIPKHHSIRDLMTISQLFIILKLFFKVTHMQQ